MARTVTVELTLQDVQVLRGLIIADAKRHNFRDWMPRSTWPSRMVRMHPVAVKIRRASEELRNGSR